MINAITKKVSMPSLLGNISTDFQPALGPAFSFVLNYPVLTYAKGAQAITKLLRGHSSRMSQKSHLQFLHVLLTEKEVVLYKKQLKQLLEQASFNLALSPTLNIIGTLRTGKQSNRIIMQYYPERPLPNGHIPQITGRLTLINHWENAGPTRIFLTNREQLLYSYTARKLEWPEIQDLNIKSKQLEVLRLKSRGWRAKQIGEELGITYFSVNSIIRDLKKDTGMPLIPLIQHLKDKGVL